MGNKIDDAVDVANVLNRMDDINDLSKVTMIGRNGDRVKKTANLIGKSDDLYDLWKGYNAEAKSIGKLYNDIRSAIHNGRWMSNTLRKGYTVIDIGIMTIHRGRGWYYGTEKLVIGIWKTRHIWKIPLNYYW